LVAQCNGSSGWSAQHRFFTAIHELLLQFSAGVDENPSIRSRPKIPWEYRQSTQFFSEQRLFQLRAIRERAELYDAGQ
jgi:fructosamine-3-kinase